MTLPQQSTLAWSIIITILHAVAISSTLFRVCHRARKHQMWYDDYLAIVPLVVDCLYITIFWISLATKDYLRYRHNDNFFTSFLFGFVVNMIVLWFSRISLALSLARIFPPGHLARRLSLSLAGLCLLFFCITSSLTIGLCQGGGRPWYNIDPHYCKKGPQRIPVSGIVGLISDIIADILLLLAPSFMLRKIKLPVNQRRLILAAFSSSILTLLSAIIFGVFWYCRIRIGPGTLVLRLVVAQIETTISLIVCNLLVVTMFFYRIFRRIHNIEAPEQKAIHHRPPPPPPRLTHDHVNEAESPNRGGNSVTGKVSTTKGSSIVTPITFTEIEITPWESFRQPSRLCSGIYPPRKQSETAVICSSASALEYARTR